MTDQSAGRPKDLVCPHCGKGIDPRRERYCNHCGEAFAVVDGVATVPEARSAPTREPAELRTRHVGSLVVGVLFLLLVYSFSLGPEASGPAERSVRAMTVGPVILVTWALAAAFGWYGIGGIASFLSQNRKDGGLWATIVVTGWLFASCVVPVVI